MTLRSAGLQDQDGQPFAVSLADLEVLLLQVTDVMPTSTGYGSVQFALDGCTDLGPPWGGSSTPASLAVTTPIPVAAPMPTPTPAPEPTPAVKRRAHH